MNLEDNIIGFHHYSLKADDIGKTINFYKTFGFKVLHSWSLQDFELERCVMMFKYTNIQTPKNKKNSTEAEF